MKTGKPVNQETGKPGCPVNPSLLVYRTTYLPTYPIPMYYLTRIISFTALMLVALTLLAACTSGSDATGSAPPPAGLQEGKPTFIYLWNSP